MKTAAKFPASYARLMRQFPLRPIRSKMQYEQASVILDRLAVRADSDLDLGESDYLETLTLLIEAYDRDFFSLPAKDEKPVEILRFLMEQNQMTQAALADVLGVGPSAASMIVSGQRPITADHARGLAARFKVDAGLFI